MQKCNRDFSPPEPGNWEPYRSDIEKLFRKSEVKIKHQIRELLYELDANEDAEFAYELTMINVIVGIEFIWYVRKPGENPYCVPTVSEEYKRNIDQAAMDNTVGWFFRKLEYELGIFKR